MRRDHLIVGREDELAQPRKLFEDDGPSCVVVDGEAGIGKTTLWHAGLEIAGNAGFTILACQPAEPERALPFSALGDLLEPLLGERLPALPRPLGIALEVGLQPREAAEPTEQIAVSRATVALLGAVDAPLLAIDDTQWLDRPSERTLEFAVRRLADTPLRLLLARRSEVPQPLPLALDRARPRLVQLRDVSGGNPFYALETARSAPCTASACRRRSRERSKRGSAHSRRPRATPSCWRRPRASRRCRCWSERRDPPKGWSRRSPPACSPSTACAPVFTHPLLASVAYDSETPWARRRAHARLAAAAEGEERARNLALGTDEPDEEVAAELERSANAAAERGGTDAAASLAEHAARLTPPASSARTRRLVAAAEHHVASGDPASARTILGRLLDELPPGAARAEILWRLAASGGMDFDESIRLAEQALEEGRDDPAACARIHTTLGVFTWLNGDLHRSLRHCREAAACAERAGDDLLHAITLGEVGHAEVVLGMPVPEADLAHAIAIEQGRDDFPAYLRPSFQLGVIRMITDDPDAARPLLEAELSPNLSRRGRVRALRCAVPSRRARAALGQLGSSRTLRGGLEAQLLGGDEHLLLERDRQPLRLLASKGGWERRPAAARLRLASTAPLGR